MDSNPIQQMMMPLKNTASLLVHANISIDSGVEILRNGIKDIYICIKEKQTEI